VNCAVCASRPGHVYEAIAIIIETGEGVCRGHIVPTLLSGYGVRPLRDEKPVAQG
jgi:hypothetical protein